MTLFRLVASLLLAAGAFASLVVSAVLFARLPPAARASTWPLEDPSVVLVDDDGRAAWVAFARSVCHVELARGEAARCDTLPFDMGAHVQHARGGDAILIVSQDGRSLTLAAVIDDSARGVTVTTSTWTDPGATPRDVANVAWSGARARFEIAMRAGRGARDVQILPVSADGVAGEPERLDVALGELPPKASSATLVAAFGGTPPTLCLAEPLEHSDMHVVRGRVMTRLPVPGCERLAALTGACVLVGSISTFRNPAPFAMWLGADCGARQSSEAAPFDLVEHRGAPVLVRRAGGKLIVPFPLAAARDDRDAADPPSVELEIVVGSGEQILYGRKSATSAWRKLARGAGAIDDWLALPGAEHLLLVRGDQVVVVDRELERTDARATWSRVEELLAERFAESPTGVVAYLAGLALFAPLLLITAVYVARTRRAPSWLVLALALYALATALFVYGDEVALFPPDAREVTAAGG